MALDLTPEELATVERAAGSNLTYYSAGLGQQVPISTDFEAFLALASAGTKTSAVQWLQSLIAPLSADINRVSLYLTCIAAEAFDLVDQRAQVEAYLAAFDEFKAGFPGDPRFAGVSEINMILEDSGLVLDQLVHLRDSLKHRSVMNVVSGGRWGNPTGDGVLTDERKKQAMSWITPLSIPLTF